MSRKQDNDHPGDSRYERLQRVLMDVHNRIVREEFSDINDEVELQIKSPRGILKKNCLIADNDNATNILLKYFLFYLDLRKAKDLQVPIYGIPIASFQESRRFKPQIQLYFEEDFSDVEEGYNPITGEISFRLMNESSSSISLAEARNYAQKIKTTFTNMNGFVWRKGKTMCAYTDRERGYKLQVLARNSTEGKRVIEQVLDIQQHMPDWKLLNVSENESPSDRYPTIPSSQNILGKTRRMPRQRPIADVRFQRAFLHVWGMPNPLVLVDRSGIHRNPLVEVD